MNVAALIQIQLAQGIFLQVRPSGIPDYLAMLADQLTAILSLMCLDEFETRSDEIQSSAIWCASTLADQIRAVIVHMQYPSTAVV